tara:strand:- start:2391 stop:2618 length:228 start_codon:yes stop_codon:yes gene_type:complete
MKVKILKTDKRLGIKAGEIYEAERYHMEPQTKVTLLSRVPDGYDPCCNQYIHEIAMLIKNDWHIVVDGVYQIEKK